VMTIKRNGRRTRLYARALAAHRWKLPTGLVPVIEPKAGVMHAIRQSHSGPEGE
jgi:hypothetical protein